MITVSTTQNSRASDLACIQKGTSSLLLMSRAAEGVFNVLKKYGLIKNKIAIVAGNGNNGGDGFALAEILEKEGLIPDTFYFEGDKSADADYYFKRVKNLKPIENFCANNYGLIIDAIFGTGLNKKIEGVYAEVINQINDAKKVVVSCDIASGLNGDNGEVNGVAVKADYTVTFVSPKVGHYLGNGRELSGKLEVVDIGVDLIDKSVAVSECGDLALCFKPLGKNIHKGSSGSAGIIGGSRNFAGAVILANAGSSALRVGAGLNHIAFPDCLYDGMTARITEGILHPLKMEGDAIGYDENVISDFSNLNAVVFGIGLGKCKYTDIIIQKLLSGSAKIVLDADALNTMNFDSFDGRGKVIITPHPKEMSRLTKLSVEEILKNPIEIAKEVAKKHNLVVLLKGSASIITDGCTVVLNTFGTPAMAKGGSGDLLSGIICGLLARGFNIFDSAYAGAGVAGLAAEYAVSEANEFSVLPSDSAKYIGAAVSKLINKRG